jgi:uncharacterized tellurite resistance protein B-like protein
MGFKDFFNLLGELGIALPEPARLKPQESQAFGNKNKTKQNPKPPSQSTRSSTKVPRSEAELMEALEHLLGESAKPQKRSPDCWVAPGKTVKIGNFAIPGMVYVGEALPALRNYGVEPCLIRPSLKLSRKPPDLEKPMMSYGLSYSQLPMEGRSAYLHWLSTGRRHRQAFIGYVWIFFYGLERRVLDDLTETNFKTSHAKAKELDQIIAEVTELKRIYGQPGQNWSFGNKAEAFLEVCHLIRSPELKPETIDPATAKPLALQIGLGQLVKQGQPIPAEWAIAWYTRLASKPLPTAAIRCPAEFQTLFQLRYTQQFGAGMKLKAGRVALHMSYFPASPSFGRSMEISLGNLPDISRFTAKLTKIGDLVQACRQELEPLNRFLSRNPDAAKTPAAIALLPPDLLPLHGGETVKKLQQWLESKLAPKTQAIVVSGAELFKYWSGSNPEKLTKTEANGLSQLLTRLGYGMEPDPTFGGALPTLKSHLALFRLAGSPVEALSPAYSRATLIAHLAIVVASGTESPSAIEQQALRAQLETIGFNPAERSRLHAHIQWLLQQNPTLRGLKTRLEPLEPSERLEIARSLVQIAAADGQVNPQEVSLLEKVYAQLDLDQQRLYGDIHDRSTTGRSMTDRSTSVISTSAAEPVTVRKGKTMAGHAIPAAQKGRKAPASGLDMALVQAKMAESQEISSLLAEIFVDEAPTPGPPAKSTRKKSSAKTQAIREIAGLDAAHSQLLLALEPQSVWQRSQLAAIATKLDLMLDGALEVINDAAFDRCDEAVIEGDDMLEVNSQVLRELLA